MASGPLTLWRISLYDSLDGEGAARGGGRWNSPGHPVVYLAESPAGAMLEILAHLPLEQLDMPEEYRLLRIETRGLVECAQFEAGLAGPWKSDPMFTRQMGDGWLESRASAILRVPSVIMPHTWNYLLNPGHPEAAKVFIAEASSHVYDPRLLRVRTQ
jgi:RES domain-containing protein